MLTSKYHRIQTHFELSSDLYDMDISKAPNMAIEPKVYSPEEEIAMVTGAYLWDYLRRSGTAGYL